MKTHGAIYVIPMYLPQNIPQKKCTTGALSHKSCHTFALKDSIFLLRMDDLIAQAGGTLFHDMIVLDTGAQVL